MRMHSEPERLNIPEPPAARLSVFRVQVEGSLSAPQLYWSFCPRCEAMQAGYATDPRGSSGCRCDSCGGEFDIPHRAILKMA